VIDRRLPRRTRVGHARLAQLIRTITFEARRHRPGLQDWRIVLAAGVAGHASQVKADAISDQENVAKALVAGLQIGPDKCTIFTKSDAERVFRAPVVHVETEADKTECAWGLAKNPSVGVLVSRVSRSDWYPPRPGTTRG
jgi:hypothetical protein